MFEKSTPKRKQEFLIIKVSEQERAIKFEATEDVFQEIKEKDFGATGETASGIKYLYVSSLFDFNEVVEYLQSFKE